MSMSVSEKMLRSIERVAPAKDTGLRLVSPAGTCAIQRMWDSGCILDLEETPQLRGYVDIYDGERHMFQCLIVASEQESGRMRCAFKRLTAVRETPPVDYVLASHDGTAREAQPAL